MICVHLMSYVINMGEDTVCWAGSILRAIVIMIADERSFIKILFYINLFKFIFTEQKDLSSLKLF